MSDLRYTRMITERETRRNAIHYVSMFVVSTAKVVWAGGRPRMLVVIIMDSVGVTPIV